MTPEWRQFIERIHAVPRQCVIAVTGGGAAAIAELLTVPGGSRTVLEAIVPYSAAALADWLGRRPEHFCSEETALAMATVAYQRARRLRAGGGETASDETPRRDESGLIGVGCTAGLVSRVPKRGEHRCHVAVQTEDRTTSDLLIFEKGVRDRAGEEEVVSHLLLVALARAAGIADPPPLELRPGEAVVTHQAVADPLLVDLAHGRRGLVWSLPDRTLLPLLPVGEGRGVLCGAFHPLHEGHRELRAAAERRLEGPVWYELSIHNVDKPPLDYLTIDRRRAQFTEHPLALTNAPTFAAKSLVLPGTVFVGGVDTAERVVQARYYGQELGVSSQWSVVSGGGSERGGEISGAMRAALEQIRRQGCRFLVAGRLVGDRFLTLEDISLPAEFADLFEALPETEFRKDISSTELRR